MKQIYDLSAGIPAYIVKIFQEAQTQAILSGKEKITYEAIKQAVSILGIEVPKVYSRGGTSISDFTVEPCELEVIGIDDAEESAVEVECEVVEESNIITLPRLPEPETVIQSREEPEPLPEVTEQPIKRFYASQRGRKQVERDKADLVQIWKQQGSAEYLIKQLEIFQMVERRCF